MNILLCLEKELNIYKHTLQKRTPNIYKQLSFVHKLLFRRFIYVRHIPNARVLAKLQLTIKAFREQAVEQSEKAYSAFDNNLSTTFDVDQIMPFSLYSKLKALFLVRGFFMTLSANDFYCMLLFLRESIFFIQETAHHLSSVKAI